MRHQPDVYSRWALEMRSKAYFHAGQRVGVAVSGGPDSLLLLHFMMLLAQKVHFILAAVHFNYHLRGSESDGDEDLVRELSASLGIVYLRDEADGAQEARSRRRNLEAVARELRYRYFCSLVDQGRLDVVATAHTANDQAETVLMRLLRGAGTRGLGGIYPQLDGKIVRPFLCLTRDEVMREVAARTIAYRIDSSNLNVRLRRNQVRVELLPLLAKHYNPQIINILNQVADRSRDDESVLERTARELANPFRAREGAEERIPIRDLQGFPPALGRRVLRQMLESVRGSSQGLSYSHIEQLRSFAADSQSGRVLTLPGGTEARKEFTWLVLGPKNNISFPQPFSYRVTLPGEVAVRELGCSFHFKILTRDEDGKAYNLETCAVLDPRKLDGDLVLRSWRPGDRFGLVGSRRVQRLKEFFRTRKIPKARRAGWPVLVCAGRIVWVKGFPPSKDVAANDHSQQLLIVEQEPLGRSRPDEKR